MDFFRSFLAAGPLILSLVGASPAEECEWNKRIWMHEAEGDRWILYFDDVGDSRQLNTYLELWRGNELSARIFGWYMCGTQLCHLNIAPSYKPFPAEIPFSDRDPFLYDHNLSVSSHDIKYIRPTDDWRDDLFLIQELHETFRSHENEHVDNIAGLEPEELSPRKDEFQYLACRTNEVSIDH